MARGPMTSSLTAHSDGAQPADAAGTDPVDQADETSTAAADKARSEKVADLCSAGSKQTSKQTSKQQPVGN